MKKVLLLLGVWLAVPLPLAATGIDFETKDGVEVYKLKLVQRPGETQWVRIEKSGQTLKFVPTSTQDGKWYDHPATAVSLTPRMCLAARSPLAELQAQMALFQQKKISDNQYAQAKRAFLAALAAPGEVACTVRGVDSVVLPEGTDFAAGSRISLEFVQVNKLWTLTFEMAPGADAKLAVRVLSTSP